MIDREQYALITGASRGLGRALAIELAQKKTNLLLLSLPGEDLVVFSEELKSAYNIAVYYFEVDLSMTQELLRLAETINASYEVFMLINNAGIGGGKKILNASIEYLTKIIQVNILSTTLLTRALLPNLIRQEKAYILNVSSLAAFTPVGYKTVYPASKVFVHAFSLGLSQELQGTKVAVSVVHPGPMATNEDVKHRIQQQGRLGKWLVADPAAIAKKCIRGLFREDKIIVVNKISWWVCQLIPSWLLVKWMKKRIKMEA